MKYNVSRVFVLLTILFLCQLKMTAQLDTTTQLQQTKQFFREAKFGMFIHWGVYSLLGGEYQGIKHDGAEWIQLHANIPADDYEKIAHTFNPTSFDPDKWMKLAKQAGMKYVVFTTKHHDGFCMFKSKYTDYNVVDYTPYKKDIVKMLADACKKNSIKLGLYYSIVDWHHPDFPAKYSQMNDFHGRPNPNADIDKYASYEYNQLKELMTNYGPVSFAWFDAGGGFKDADRFKLLKGDSVIKMIRKYQPECLINSRIGGKADYGTPEQTIPGSIQDQAFEVCMTINNNWGYAKNDNQWKSTEDLVRKLIEVAHKGGNFLLNVGPDSHGSIPDSSIVRLQGMGKWLDVNGESIYGTKNSLWESPSWGRSTTRFLKNGNTVLYFHVYNWPDDHSLFIPGLKNRALKAFVFTTSGKKQLRFSQLNKGISIDLTSVVQDKIATVVGLEVGGQKFELVEIKDQVLKLMEHVADWQIANQGNVKHHELDWTNATLYRGMTELASMSENGKYNQWLMDLGLKYKWQPFYQMYMADDIAVSQMYLDMYKKSGDKRMLDPTTARTEWVINHPSVSSLKLNYADYLTLERWSWCDALFMAPPVYAQMYNITRDPKYLDFMNKEYKATYNFLYNKEDKLFFRDGNYINKKEANGKNVYWGRGNGWVMGGLVKILQEIPNDVPSRKFYENLFQEMSSVISGLQDKNGYWHASLLDTETYPNPETSCSGFFVYALAYGINSGLLDKKKYLPIVLNGWKALENAVFEDGKLGWVQPVGENPRLTTREMTDVYGVGAFLLAGSEIYKLIE